MCEWFGDGRTRLFDVGGDVVDGVVVMAMGGVRGKKKRKTEKRDAHKRGKSELGDLIVSEGASPD